MAWNPSPKVAAARDFGKRFQKSTVIIISIDDDGGCEYVSYGKTRMLCDEAKRLGDKIFGLLGVK